MQTEGLDTLTLEAEALESYSVTEKALLFDVEVLERSVFAHDKGCLLDLTILDQA